jgi:hypothetical protein
MRDILESLARGDLSVAAAEAALSGYATTDAGRFDAARETRRGVPEAVLADGKTPAEVADLATTALETAGRAIVTRAAESTTVTVQSAIADAYPDADVTVHERAGVLVAHRADYEAPAVDATVAVVSAGTSDAQPVGEAAVMAAEMGASVTRVTDVGVAALGRIVDHLDELRDADVAVVAAGREGALPTVVAGLVDTPVIGLPVSTGYGHGGDGEAALLGMLQSCSVLSVVNIDAGFVAGAQAGLIARAVGGARA